MVYNSRVLAFLIALCVSLITTLSLFFFGRVDSITLLVTAGVCFSVSFILVFAVFEFLIFREIELVHRLIKELKGKKQPVISGKKKSGVLSLAEKINEEILLLTQLKQKEIDELKKLEAFRKEFIADVSHELKTPIFAAQGFVHTLIDGAVNDKSVRNKFLRKAAKSLDGLDALVQDLLTLSQIETGDIKITIRTTLEGNSPDITYVQQAPMQQQMTQAAPVATPVAAPATDAAPAAVDESSKYITIKSPIIGTFYRKPSPDKPVFAEVGATVQKGDVLCVIEAMKLFNEIESEISGKIVKILVDDMSPVEFDQPLFLVDPS